MTLQPDINENDHASLAGRFGALILAGGRSLRMGHPKCWLSLTSGETFLENSIRSYLDAGIRQIKVVICAEAIDSPWTENIRKIAALSDIVRNDYPERGRLYSIFLGLQGTANQKIFLHNVDHPGIGPEVIQTMMASCGQEEVTVPSFEGKCGHPVIIDRQVGLEILQDYTAYPTLRALLARYKRREVPVQHPGIFTNINTPAEYQAVYGYL